MELQPDQRIVINPDGSANVLNSKNESITTILKPWAKDSNNKDLKTFYTVDKNILQQHIETNSMTKYPVKADPTWCGNFWNDVGWVTEHDIYQNRRYGQIVRVTPSWCLDMLSKTVGAVPNSWLACDSWRELLDRLPANNNAWPNRAYGTEVYWSLNNQMACHITWVKWANAVGMASGYIQRNNPIYRNSYHLESYRPNYGYWGFTNRLCNDGRIINY